jgi:hypothetical protein
MAVVLLNGFGAFWYSLASRVIYKVVLIIDFDIIHSKIKNVQ